MKIKETLVRIQTSSRMRASERLAAVGVHLWFRTPPISVIPEKKPAIYNFKGSSMEIAISRLKKVGFTGSRSSLGFRVPGTIEVAGLRFLCHLLWIWRCL